MKKDFIAIAACLLGFVFLLMAATALENNSGIMACTWFGGAAACIVKASQLFRELTEEDI